MAAAEEEEAADGCCTVVQSPIGSTVVGGRGGRGGRLGLCRSVGVRCTAAGVFKIHLMQYFTGSELHDKHLPVAEVDEGSRQKGTTAVTTM